MSKFIWISGYLVNTAYIKTIKPMEYRNPRVPACIRFYFYIRIWLGDEEHEGGYFQDEEFPSLEDRDKRIKELEESLT